MNATNSRRNGKPASCEPCRLNKTKCDHGHPKCERCRQRGIEDRCFYHPAPLTKPHKTADESGTGEARPLKRKRPTRQDVLPDSAFPPTSPLSEDRLADAVAADVYHPGFLGPGSYAVLLPQDEDSRKPLEREESVASERSDRELTHQYTLSKSMRHQMANNVLVTLRHYDSIRELVLWFNASNEASVIPAQLQIDAINALESVVDKHNLRQSPPSPQFIAQVLESTSRPFVFSQSLEAHELQVLCSGENLRFEIVGCLLATAGRSLTFGFAPAVFNDPAHRGSKSRLVDELLRASTTCLFLTTMLATVNDLTILLYYENFHFTTLMCGFAGPPSWRRIGELSTQLYALGIHQDKKCANAPIWLRETRRRIFCSSYNYDKIISTFMGRPIRISKRHTDMSLPLDLSDDETTADKATLDTAIQSLDGDGWNTKGRWLRASWIRLRHISLRFREEILEFSFIKIDEDTKTQLLDISQRVRSAWETLPKHMRYWKTCWEEDVPSKVCLMLIIVDLTHWYNEFMIQKLLDYTPLTLNTALLRVSVDLLSKVLTLGTIRDRSYDVHRDMLHAVLLFGVPAASVLATALREQHQTGQHFPAEVSRAEIIRMLSVLINHLDAAAHAENSGARQGEANYNLCRKASKLFTRVIDTILEPRAVEELTAANEQLGLDLGLDLFAGPGLDGFEGMEFSGLGLGFGANTGINEPGMDWGSAGQWDMWGGPV